ncbi:MAG: protein translocase subunit SecF [Clostridia bacterium]|nr:protein translocase subunit SecF [Clostridia bacterium]
MKNNKLLSSLSSMPIAKNWKFWIIAPIVILVVAVVLIAALGSQIGYTNAVNIGIDFEGGTLVTVTIGQDAIDNYDYHVDRITDAIEKHGVVVSYVQLQEAQNVNETSISFRYKNISKNDDEISALNEVIREELNNSLYAEIKDNVTYESIGATAAQDLLSKSGIALAISLALILIYIIIRFTPASGIAAILALIHDVVIMFCLSVICRVQINQSFVAAIITIIAYSINNTIIIFDRCRENVKPLKGQKDIPYAEIGDQSVRENMRRSLFTTFTTMVTVIFLAIFGSDTIREFCVPIILGLVAGLYSSVLLATPMWVGLSKEFDRLMAKYRKSKPAYEGAKVDDEDETVYRGETIKEYYGEEQVVAAPKADKPKNNKSNAIHKYSKKNTTFKKKK